MVLIDVTLDLQSPQIGFELTRENQFPRKFKLPTYGFTYFNYYLILNYSLILGGSNIVKIGGGKNKEL